MTLVSSGLKRYCCCVILFVCPYTLFCVIVLASVRHLILPCGNAGIRSYLEVTGSQLDHVRTVVIVFNRGGRPVPTYISSHS